MSKKELKVCWLSAGVSSFIAGYLKRDSIDLYIYIDIENQHPDSMRFIKDCEKILGKEILILKSPYRNKENVIRQFRYINGPSGAKCTEILKKRVRKEWEMEHREYQITYVWGFDMDERRRAERICEAIRQKEYQHLLGKEIAFCCDCIALNILQRPTQGSIADCAVDNLNRRIQVAQLSNLPSPYNLSIFLHVLQLDGKAYLRVDCNNPIFQKAFRSLEDVSVSAVECQDPKNSKNILWQKLCKRYEEMLPLSKNLTTELYPDWEHITYPDVNSRCEDFARQNIANSYLTHLNAGQQMIPPHLLMPYVEESIDYLQSEYGKNEYREKVLFLKKVFIDLNADDSIVRNIQPQFKTEEEPVINENTETDLEK